MAIIRWNPWNIKQILEEDFDMPTLPGISRLVGQGLNLYETDDEIIAQAAMPGISEDRIDVTIEDDVVRITGSYEEKEEDRKKKRYFMSSMSSSYDYSFRLPKGVVKTQEPSCELSDGILSLKFKKEEKTPPKKIKISKKLKESKS